MQEAELPLAKLEILLSIVSMIIETTTNTRGQALGADDFLPLLVYIVAKCGFIAAEIEAEFMWCLLQPSLLNGEAGYYLTALCSAVHVLKSFITSEQDGSGTLDVSESPAHVVIDMPFERFLIIPYCFACHLYFVGTVSIVFVASMFVRVACDNTRWVQWLVADSNITNSAAYNHQRSVSNDCAQGTSYKSARLWLIQTCGWRRLVVPFISSRHTIHLQDANSNELINFSHFSRRNFINGLRLSARSPVGCTRQTMYACIQANRRENCLANNHHSISIGFYLPWILFNSSHFTFARSDRIHFCRSRATQTNTTTHFTHPFAGMPFKTITKHNSQKKNELRFVWEFKGGNYLFSRF